VRNFRILSSEIWIGVHLEIISGAPVHLAKGSFCKGIDIGFFRLPSSSNAANDVKQLVRRRTFPRAIVGCNCFADIVQNAQGGQCLQPTAIYNSHQFFCLRVSAALLTDCQYSQRASTHSCFKGHCILLGAATRTPVVIETVQMQRRRQRSIASLRGLLMSHGHPLGKAWLRQRWRMSISPVEKQGACVSAWLPPRLAQQGQHWRPTQPHM
jgi:hypothetical protein